MIQPKKNKCRGSGGAIDFGCGELVFRFKYGLCRDCYKNWLHNTPKGKEMLLKTIKKAVKQVNKPKARKYIKWYDKDFQQMIKYVQDNICNPYIRLRDIQNGYMCISGGGKIHDAGHFFPVNNNIKMRFCIANIHGQSISHNRDITNSGHQNEYRQGLTLRFDEKYVKILENIKKQSENWPKLDRSELIEIGKTYEHLTKHEIWCFTHEEFTNYKNIINK